MTVLWHLMHVCTVIGIVAGIAIWGLPKKWIIKSPVMAKLLSNHGPSPWRWSNRLGKAIYIMFYGSIVAILILALIGLYV